MLGLRALRRKISSAFHQHGSVIMPSVWCCSCSRRRRTRKSLKTTLSEDKLEHRLCTAFEHRGSLPSTSHNSNYPPRMSWLPAPFNRCQRYIASMKTSTPTTSVETPTLMNKELCASQELPSITTPTPTTAMTSSGPQFTYDDSESRKLNVPQIVLFRRHSDDLRIRRRWATIFMSLIRVVLYLPQNWLLLDPSAWP